jgi:hypothetical protein
VAQECIASALVPHDTPCLSGRVGTSQRSRWRNSTLIARRETAALPMIGRAAALAGGWGGEGDRDRTGMVSLEGCAPCAVRGLDRWSGRVRGARC